MNLKPHQIDALQSILENRSKLFVIKALRDISGMGLREAKDFYERNAASCKYRTELAEKEKALKIAEDVTGTMLKTIEGLKEQVASLEGKLKAEKHCLRAEERLARDRLEKLDAYRVVLKDAVQDNQGEEDRE